MTEAKDYNPDDYPRVAVAVDVAVLTVRDGALRALAVRRDEEPLKGMLALPGTFLRPDETTHFAAERAIADKANVETLYLEQLATFSRPDRDPRMRVVSVAYLAFGPLRKEPTPGERVSGIEWVTMDDSPDFAFDHDQILWTAFARAADKLEYTTLATRFLPSEFTRADLHRVYEAVWGHKVDKPNFYRKVEASEGFIEPVGKVSQRGVLFKAGLAGTLYPPIRREGGKW